jgi:hypothetical protein
MLQHLKVQFYSSALELVSFDIISNGNIKRVNFMLLIAALMLAASAHGVFGITNVSLSIAELTQHRGHKDIPRKTKKQGNPS